MLKAVREAKRHTSWLTPNEAYEDGVQRFVSRILGPDGSGKFLPAFLPFQQKIARIAVTNSLAQVVLKAGSPGVPDFYQGTELWDLSLVDPDNRRPVDFEGRQALLARVDDEGEAAIPEMVEHWEDGRLKLFVTTRALRLRRELPDVFAGGDYLPLRTEVTVLGDLVAFARTAGDSVVIVAAPTLASRLGCEGPPVGADCWRTSRIMLPEALHRRTFVNVLTGAEVRPTIGGHDAWLFVGQLFAQLPVAVLRTV